MSRWAPKKQYGISVQPEHLETIQRARRAQRAIHRHDAFEPKTMNLSKTARVAMLVHSHAVIEYAEHLGLEF